MTGCSDGEQFSNTLQEEPGETLPDETISFILYEFLDTEKELILSENHTYRVSV